MSGEFDPTNELGLFPEKMMACGVRGFLTRGDSLRQLCRRFIPNGDRFLDVLERYDMLTAYVIGRDEAVAGNAAKWALPFLRGCGATDHSVHVCAEESLKVMPGASEAMGYMSKLMPSFITTSTYEQAMLPLEAALDAPLAEAAYSQTLMDHSNFGRMYSKNIRKLAAEISELEIPAKFYALNQETSLDEKDIRIIEFMDEVLNEKISGPGESLMESCVIMNSSKKAYRLLDLRRSNNVDLDGTVYIAGDHSDYQTMNLVQESMGLSMAFNGSEYAVRGSNIAVISKSSTVGALLAYLFYDKGIQAVTELAENWSRDALKEFGFTDRYLADMLLAETTPWPEVYVVNKDNMDRIAARSDKVHEMMMKERHRIRCVRRLSVRSSSLSSASRYISFRRPSYSSVAFQSPLLMASNKVLRMFMTAYGLTSFIQS